MSIRQFQHVLASQIAAECIETLRECPSLYSLRMSIHVFPPTWIDEHDYDPDKYDHDTEVLIIKDLDDTEGADLMDHGRL